MRYHITFLFASNKEKAVMMFLVATRMIFLFYLKGNGNLVGDVGEGMKLK
jgi:hypothetical protein